ncbi:MAG: hypothetical protein WBG90_04935 [Saonia sp.]
MKEFDHFIRTKLDTLNRVPDVEFNEERVWKKIKPRIRTNFGSDLFNFISMAIVVVTGICILFYIFGTSSESSDTINFELERKKDVPKGNVILDTVATLKTEPLLTKKVSSKADFIAKKIPTDTLRVRPLEIKPVVLYHAKTDLNTSEEKGKAAPQESIVNSRRTAVVHIYRPKRYVGSGLVFKLKANGRLIHKVKNGKRTVVELKPGHTQFMVGKSISTIVLRPGEIYYLRVSCEGFPIARPELEVVSKDYAKNEMGRD